MSGDALTATSTPPESMVIVGGGVAGGSAALALRSAGFMGQIVVVCAEPTTPYARPPLSKALLRGTMSVATLALRPASI